MFFSDKLGVIVDKAIVVEIRVYADEKRTKLVGSQTAELVFDQPDVDRFLANFPSAFKNQTAERKQAAVISGWRDLPASRSDVPGSLADPKLQVDIQLSIWKFDSTRRWSCEREVLSASTMEVEEDTINAERWAVRSCGEERVFDVFLSASQLSGTDILIVDPTELTQ